MLYIYNENNLAIIVCKERVQKAESTAFSIVKGLCKRELFSYESRSMLTKNKLNIKTKIPIYINENVLLMPTNSPKRYDTHWINYYEVFSFEKYFNGTIILFYNLNEKLLDVSYKSFKIMMEKASIINKYFEERLVNHSL